MKHEILILSIILCALCTSGCKSRHETNYEEFTGLYDTTYKMIDTGFVIGTLDSIRSKPFVFVKTNIDSALICNQSFWDKNISLLDYVDDSVKTNLTYVNDEGNQYAIVNKMQLTSINLVTLGRNSFNAKNIEYYDLLITDNANRPIFFCYVESLSRGLTLDQAQVSDTAIFIQFSGKEFNDGFIEKIEIGIKMNHLLRTVDYYKSWRTRDVVE